MHGRPLRTVRVGRRLNADEVGRVLNPVAVAHSKAIKEIQQNTLGPRALIRKRHSDTNRYPWLLGIALDRHLFRTDLDVSPTAENKADNVTPDDGR